MPGDGKTLSRQTGGALITRRRVLSLLLRGGMVNDPSSPSPVVRGISMLFRSFRSRPSNCRRTRIWTTARRRWDGGGDFSRFAISPVSRCKRSTFVADAFLLTGWHPSGHGQSAGVSWPCELSSVFWVLLMPKLWLHDDGSPFEAGRWCWLHRAIVSSELHAPNNAGPTITLNSQADAYKLWRLTCTKPTTDGCKASEISTKNFGVRNGPAQRS